MKKIILALMLLMSIECLVASDVNASKKYDTLDVLSDTIDLVDMALSVDEINIKLASCVKHHFDVDGLTWNENWKNSAKGIEFIKYINENHGVGLTYITFRNSFNIRTEAGGFVYKYTSSNDYFGIRPNVKLYGLYQKGYYGSWNDMKGYDANTDNKFFAPLASTGFEYKNFTVDIVGTMSTLHAVTFGYSFKL